MKITVKDFCHTCGKNWSKFSDHTNVVCGEKTDFVFRTFGVGKYTRLASGTNYSKNEHCKSCSTKLFDIELFKIPSKLMKKFLFYYIKYLTRGRNES